MRPGSWPAVVVLALALGCASSIELGQRPFPCHPDAGAPAEGVQAECPDRMRCGLEAVCHPVGVGGPYQCNSDEDCEGWHCGHEGVCHDPAVAAAYSCATSADCELGWRCGVAGSCYPRDAGFVAYSCREDLDCTEQARCGRTGTCQALGVAGPYPCTTDSDCEAAWGCGFAGHCVDPTPDRVDPAAFGVAITVDRVSPELTAMPAQWATGPGLTAPSSVLFVTDGGLELWKVARRDLLLDGGISPGTQLFRTGWPADRTLGLVADADGGFALTTDGLFRIDALPDGGLATALLSASVHDGRLRAVDEPVRNLVSFTDQAYWLATPATGAAALLQLPSFSGPGAQPILDMAGVDQPAGARFSGCLLAVGAQGLFVAPRTDGGEFLLSDGGASGVPEWGAFDAPLLPNTSCGTATPGPGALRPLAVRPVENSSGNELVVAGTLLSAPDAGLYLTLIDGSNSPSTVQPGCLPAARCGFGLPGAVQPACLACAPGQRLADFYASAAEFGSVVATCEEQDAGVSLFHNIRIQLGSVCEYIPLETLFAARGRVPYPPLLDVERAAPPRPGGLPVLATAHGQVVGFWQYDNSLSLTPPARVDAVTEWGGAVHGVVGFDRTLYRLDPPFGFEAITFFGGPSQQLFYPVENRPGWASVQNDVVDLAGVHLSGFSLVLPTVARINPSVPRPLLPPSRGLLAPIPDGGGALVVTVHDTVVAGELPGDAQDGGIAVLTAKVVPQLKIPLLAVVAVPPSAEDGGVPPALEGYLLSQTSLFHFDALTIDRWHLSEVPMPEGDWADAWQGEGGRARVGYQDGRTYALPSRVQLASALPDGAGAAVQYGEVCGRPLVMTEHGLYVLAAAPDAGPAGWTAVELGGALRAGVPSGLAGGTLHCEGQGCWLSTRYGEVLEVKSASGCP